MKVQPLRPKYRFPLIPFDQIKAPSGSNYLVKGLIPAEGFVLVWGPPKCGKSFWVYDLVMHAALDREYRGRRVKKCRVVYVACEGERGLEARTEAFRRQFLAEDSQGVPFFLLPTRLNLIADTPELIENIQEQLGNEGCGVIVIDTLNRSLSGSESSDEDMGAYVKAVDQIREAFGCVVIVIHHCGHDGSRPRGHSSLGGALDAQVAVKRDAAGVLSATLEFAKDAPDGDEILSRLTVVELDEDEDGDAITSCVIAPADDATIHRASKRPSVKGAAKTALDLLRNAIDEAGQIPPANTHIPDGRRAVSEEVWRERCYRGTVSKSETAASRQKAFVRASQELQSKDLIWAWDGWVWTVDK
jgi:hypothetical protein